MGKLSLMLLAFLVSFNVFSDCEMPISQVEINQCAANDYLESDIELNQVYNQLMSGNELDDQNKEKLRKAQLKWIAFKEAQCELEGDIEARGKSMEPLILFGCLKNLTDLQIQKLKNITM